MQVLRDDSHKYTIDGVRVPGVTEVIAAAGYMGNTAYYNDDARDKGTDVHRICELHDKGTLVPEQIALCHPGKPEYYGYLEAWKKFRAETGFVPTEIELIVGHPTLLYAGTLDRTGEYCGCETVADIKSGSPVWWHAVQTAGYGGLVSTLVPRIGVYLKDTGRYVVYEHDDYMDWDKWLTALNLWKIKEPHGRNMERD